MKIWRCPTCKSGKRAPSRMRKLDSRRYCLVCSASSPLLVERVCEALERVREGRAARKQAESERQRERRQRAAEELRQSYRGMLAEWGRRWLRLRVWRDAVRNVEVQIRIARGAKLDVYNPTTGRHERAEGISPLMSSGHAWIDRFVVTAGTSRSDALATILHEIAHCAAPYGEMHGDRWRSLFATAVHEVTGETPSGRSMHDLHTAARQCLDRWLERVPFSPFEEVHS